MKIWTMLLPRRVVVADQVVRLDLALDLLGIGRPAAPLDVRSRSVERPAGHAELALDEIALRFRVHAQGDVGLARQEIVDAATRSLPLLQEHARGSTLHQTIHRRGCDHVALWFLR